MGKMATSPVLFEGPQVTLQSVPSHTVPCTQCTHIQSPLTLTTGALTDNALRTVPSHQMPWDGGQRIQQRTAGEYAEPLKGSCACVCAG